MIFLFEKHPYKTSYLNKILPLDNKGKFFVPFTEDSTDTEKSLDAVGYIYNKNYKDDGTLKDSSNKIVCILPKVFLDENGKSAFGVNFADDNSGNAIDPIVLKHKQFFASLALWVCSSISQYRQQNKNVNDVEYPSPKGKDYSRGKMSPTLMDVVNSMKQFYEDNKDIFVFVSKNAHRGYNRIDWRKTVAKKTAAWQNGSPVYMEVINRRKAFDLDDRLLVLYFSAMNYIAETFGITMPKSEFYKPLLVNEFRKLLGHRGLMEIRRIKHKYFADKFLKLYNIVYAFFEWGGNFQSSGEATEYLLVKKYNNVFEHMIDTLLGDRIPNDIKFMKTQRDGKEIDHLYKDVPLIFGEEESRLWFVGDSKYYSEGKQLSRGDISKQFTYAKNIVQYNIFDSFTQGKSDIRYRDELTEGYNVTPNFFIRGFLPAYDSKNEAAQFKDSFFRSNIVKDEKLSKGKDSLLISRESDDAEKFVIKDDDGNKRELHLWELRNRHFVNRLFDRDTLLLQVYNINFLYVLKAFTGKRSSLRSEIKMLARKKFRDEFMELLDNKYYFWAVFPKSGSIEDYVDQNFKKLLGKIYHRSPDDRFLVLALEKENSENQQTIQMVLENAKMLRISVLQFVESRPVPENSITVSARDCVWNERGYGFVIKTEAFKEDVRNNIPLAKYLVVQDGDMAGKYLLNGGIFPESKVGGKYDDIVGYFLPCKEKVG